MAWQDARTRKRRRQRIGRNLKTQVDQGSKNAPHSTKENEMRRRFGIKTYVYEVGNDFMVDIVDDVDRSLGEPIWNVYLYKEGYGTKMYMFGLPKSQTPTLKDAKSIVQANLPDYCDDYGARFF
jgi:hypothetical protein